MRKLVRSILDFDSEDEAHRGISESMISRHRFLAIEMAEVTD